MRGLRLYNPHETQHRLLYAANSREVFPEKLDRHLPNLQKRLADEAGQFAYLGFVEGEYLNQHVNGERTSFSFPTDRNDDGMFEEITLDAIRDGALDCVSSDLQPFLEEINTEKRTTITNYITDEAPQYRPLARYMDEFIDSIPPGAKGHRTGPATVDSARCAYFDYPARATTAELVSWCKGTECRASMQGANAKSR